MNNIPHWPVTLPAPAWRSLFTVRITCIWPYLTPLLRGMTLVSRAERPGFETHRTVCRIGYFYCYSALYFCSLKFKCSFAIFWKSTRVRCRFLFFRLPIVFHRFYIRNLNRKYTLEKTLLRKRYFCPYEAMVKVSCSVISESRKISKSLLVTITKVTMKLHNV